MAAPEEAENVFDVILGTYEEFLLGYALQKGNDGQFRLQQFFTNHSHLGSVRCVAAGGKFVASGSVDETIRLFNMRSRSEMGSLMQHEGTINSLQFYKSSHLFSASDDMTVCIWCTGSWQCLKTLRGHKAEVLSLAVHPSGKLLLSVSKDKTLRTWNLVKGRNAYITNIKAVAEFVQWSPDGAYFVVGVGNALDVYSTEKAGKVHSIDFGKRVGAAAFVSDDVVMLSGEGGNVEVHNVRRKCVYQMFAAHANRVKAMQIVKVPPDDATFLVTAGSDGSVRVWNVDQDNLDANPSLLCEVRCGCRITCMAVHSVHDEDSRPRKAKRRKKNKNEVCAMGDNERVGEDASCNAEQVVNSEDFQSTKRFGESSRTSARQAKDVSFSEEIEIGQHEAESGAGDDDVNLDASGNIENEGDDNARAAEQTTQLHDHTKQRIRKRKEKAAKEDVMHATKQMKVSPNNDSSQKEQVVDTPHSKNALKRKKKGRKCNKQE
ncbi:p21-activated protein kinase-interacting protein 1-like [Dermacentor andersoni]|uniref:p21-activated protein kinase-interacting protein 1-like n=1 Tax=Dermacentor andersoni TaxID=34620 RepID=UPI00215537F2|nr:p21-activated protein kinase-interacting protein 1-like [Dermacentor andersoni]